MPKTTDAASTGGSAHDHEADYAAFLQGVRTRFAEATIGQRAVFTTDAADLFDLYVRALPGEHQVHTCNTCRKFIETYGGLVTVNDDGSLNPVMWGLGAPTFYGDAVDGMAVCVKRSRVTGVFLTKEAMWGTPTTGPWSHLYAVPSRELVYREGALTAGQAMAAAKENMKTVATALLEFKPALLDEGLRILKADAVARAERFVAPVQWLRDLHDRPKGTAGQNLLWRAVALAPEGYLHPRAAVTGSLLEDIAAGLPFDDVQRKFNAKMAPLQYQRPQAPPSAGNIKAAEALFERLGLEPALHRRYARLDELPLLWSPLDDQPPAGKGVFGHLKTKEQASNPNPLTLPVQKMTWEKFSRTVLPTALRMQVMVEHSDGRFIAITTAENPDAPPILKWDREEERNPLAWYVYPGGSPASQWKLTPGYNEVTGITPLPSMIGSKPMPFLGEGVILVVKGAIDTKNQSAALFPECLKDDLHSVRGTVEAYSRSARVGGADQASACGMDLRKSGFSRGFNLRVFSANAWSDYHIDRWD